MALNNVTYVEVVYLIISDYIALRTQSWWLVTNTGISDTLANTWEFKTKLSFSISDTRKQNKYKVRSAEQMCTIK
jgi:hypothetical protein